MSTITLLSQENESFQAPLEELRLSKLIDTMCEDEDGLEIPLPNVPSKFLKKIIEFCVHYKQEPLAPIEKPLKSNDLAKIIPVWYSEFIDMPQDELFDLILATNYMDIKELLDLSCAKVASMIKGRKPEEIRKLFNIKEA